MTNGQNEAFSRVLIDKALEFSGWDLLDPRQVVFELHTGGGRADYLLKDKLGRILCVLEAKRENLDPYDAKEQARGYPIAVATDVPASRTTAPTDRCKWLLGDFAALGRLLAHQLSSRDIEQVVSDAP